MEFRATVIILILSFESLARSEIVLEPPKQYEGRTVSVTCKSITFLESVWNIERPVSLDFLLGIKKKNSHNILFLTKYVFKERHGIIIPGTNRQLSVDFPFRNTSDKDSNMRVQVHGVRCEDSHQTSYCRMMVVLKGHTRKETGLTEAGFIEVMPHPTKPNLLTDGGNQNFIELEENKFVTFKCSAHATDGLRIHWMRAFPLFNKIHYVVKKHKRAWSRKGVRHKVCKESFIFPYHSTYSLKIKAVDDFSVIYCVMFDKREGNLTSSKKMPLFVKPKPILPSGEGKLAPNLPLLGDEEQANNPSTNAVYQEQMVRMYCNTSVANIALKEVMKTVRLRLTYIQTYQGADPVEREIYTMIPSFPQYNVKASKSIHPASDFRLLGMNGSKEHGVSDVTMMWTIRQANCTGRATYICTVWYAGDPKIVSSTHRAMVKSSYQNIDFQCGITLVQMMAYSENGTFVPPEKALPAQHLTMSCHILGPRSVTWNITGYGYVIYHGNSTHKNGKKATSPSQKYPGCVCYTHDVNFSVQVPVLNAQKEYTVANCHVSVPGVPVKTMSYVINKKKNEPNHSLIRAVILAIGATVLTVIFCVILGKHCKKTGLRKNSDSSTESKRDDSVSNSGTTSSSGFKRSSITSITKRPRYGRRGPPSEGSSVDDDDEDDDDGDEGGDDLDNDHSRSRSRST